MKVKKLMLALSAFIGIIALGGGVFWGSRRLLKTTHEVIVINGLPSRINGLKILHISDVHSESPEKITRFISPGTERQSGITKLFRPVTLWEAAERLEFDIVAITGDIVDRNAYQIEPHLPYIKKLADKYPVYFAEGNHDHYSMKKLRPLLEGSGVTVLVDEKTLLRINDEEIEVVGLSDFYTADIDVGSALFDETENFRLALMHQPQYADYVNLEASPCLALAGHTHGGQVRVPFLPTLYAPGQGFFPKYGYGEYEAGEAKMFVSKGIGYTGKAPLRIWNRPEINVIELRSNEK